MEGMDAEHLNNPDGNHQLAAVMFTDVVGFSSRAHANEAETLQLVARDLRRIKEIAVSHRGRVLKTLGDGVLIHFQSATDAVRCGIEFQTCMQQEKNTLQHRVGIHLGDMYVSESEVMGDGVNIASRLQTIAEPGGICVSQTVYDIIKNKVALKATHLGAKELKNISHAVHVYKIVIGALEEGKESRGSSMAAQEWKRGVERISAGITACGDKGMGAVRHCLATRRSRIATALVGLVVAAGLIGGNLVASRGTAEAPKELSLEQVERALAGRTVDMGKILFAPTRGEIRRQDIVALSLKKTAWERKAGCFRSTYSFTLKVRGSRRSYQALIDHDGNGKLLKLDSIAGPL